MLICALVARLVIMGTKKCNVGILYCGMSAPLVCRWEGYPRIRRYRRVSSPNPFTSSPLLGGRAQTQGLGSRCKVGVEVFVLHCFSVLRVAAVCFRRRSRAKYDIRHIGISPHLYCHSCSGFIDVPSQAHTHASFPQCESRWWMSHHMVRK